MKQSDSAPTAGKPRTAKTPESNLGKRRRSAQAKDGTAYAARREELIASAAEVFQEAGYDAATLSDIAKRAGTDRASIYYYASSKEELFQQVCSGMLDSNLAAAEEIAGRQIDTAAKLRLIIEHHVTTNTRDNPQWAVLIQEMRRVAAAETTWGREAVASMRQYETVVRTILESGIANGEISGDVEPTVAMHAIFGMLNWTHRWFRPDSKFSTETIAHTFVRVAIDGLATSH